MGLLRIFKEKYHAKEQEEISQQAEELITISDFESRLFIAYSGTPLIPLREDWTSEEIVQELYRIRQNYINSKIKTLCC